MPLVRSDTYCFSNLLQNKINNNMHLGKKRQVKLKKKKSQTAKFQNFWKVLRQKVSRINKKIGCLHFSHRMFQWWKTSRVVKIFFPSKTNCDKNIPFVYTDYCLVLF